MQWMSQGAAGIKGTRGGRIDHWTKVLVDEQHCTFAKIDAGIPACSH